MLFMPAIRNSMLVTPRRDWRALPFARSFRYGGHGSRGSGYGVRDTGLGSGNRYVMRGLGKSPTRVPNPVSRIPNPEGSLDADSRYWVWQEETDQPRQWDWTASRARMLISFVNSRIFPGLFGIPVPTRFISPTSLSTRQTRFAPWRRCIASPNPARKSWW